MPRVFKAAVGLALIAGSAYLIWASVRPSPPSQAAQIGAYASHDGEIIAFSEAADACLRYVFFTGEAGRACRRPDGGYAGATYLDGQGPDAVGIAFTDDAVRLERANRRAFSAQAVDVERIDTAFTSQGTRLRGQLLVPPGENRINLAILVQGSSRRSAILANNEHHFLSAKGIAAFVYDKRGTGGSDGTYTQDFEVLARDAAAAVVHARDLLGARIRSTGLVGFSQGGWVAPLAATQADVDFLVVAYGLAVSPAEEERSEIMRRVEAAGYDGEAAQAAGKLADAVVDLAVRDFAGGADDFTSLKSLATSQGWLEHLPEGNITADVSSYPLPIVRLLWRFHDVDTSWNHDALAVLASLDMPQLWLLGRRDEQAPNTRTIELLDRLRENNPGIRVELFETAGHAMIERPMTGGHPRQRYVPEYVESLVRFVSAQ